MRPESMPGSLDRADVDRGPMGRFALVAKPGAKGSIPVARRPTALAIAILVAVLAGGAGMASRSETLASSGSPAPPRQSQHASPTDEEPIIGRQASELFLEYLMFVIAKR